jgi:hypothetical protein
MSEWIERAKVYRDPTTESETVGYQEKQLNFLTNYKKVQR